jgi:hypothetical protein
LVGLGRLDAFVVLAILLEKALNLIARPFTLRESQIERLPHREKASILASVLASFLASFLVFYQRFTVSLLPVPFPQFPPPAYLSAQLLSSEQTYHTSD